MRLAVAGGELADLLVLGGELAFLSTPERYCSGWPE